MERGAAAVPLYSIYPSCVWFEAIAGWSNKVANMSTQAAGVVLSIKGYSVDRFAWMQIPPKQLRICNLRRIGSPAAGAHTTPWAGTDGIQHKLR